VTFLLILVNDIDLKRLYVFDKNSL